MRKIYLFATAILLVLNSFAQSYTVKLGKTTSGKETFYQGILTISGTVTSLENASLSGFVPNVGQYYELSLTGVKTSSYIGELTVNLVDVSSWASGWLELCTNYRILDQKMYSSDDPANLAANFTIAKNTGSIYSRLGDYRMVFRAKDIVAGVDTIMLTFNEASFARDSRMRAFFEEQPASAYSINVGETTDLEQMIQLHYLTKDNESKYVIGTDEETGQKVYSPYWFSSDESVAKVSQNGVVTGVGRGSAKITTYRAFESTTSVSKVQYNEETKTYDTLIRPVGTAFNFKLEHEVTVTDAPDLTIPWNQYGTDFEGIGIEGKSDNWQDKVSDKLEDAIDAYQPGLSNTWSPVYGDVFTVHMKGTASFTGYIEFGLADERPAVDYWAIMADFVEATKVVEGEEFECTLQLPITSLVKEGSDVALTSPDLIIGCYPTAGSSLGTDTYMYFWLDEFEVGYIPATDYSVEFVDAPAISMEVGESKVLTLILNNLTGKGTWASSYENVAIVEQDGSAIVKGIAVGTVTVTYTEFVAPKVSYTASIEISVQKEGEAPIPYIAQNEFSYCEGDASAVLEAVKTVENGEINWYDSEEKLMASAPVANTENAGEFVYYVSQTVDDLESEKLKITIVVNAKPAAPSVENSERTICAGTPTTFVAESDGKLTWLNSEDRVVTTDKTLSQTEMNPGVRTFSVYATSEAGCVGESTAITLNLTKVPSVTISGSDALKIKETGSFIANATSENSVISSYKWTVAGVESSETSNTLEASFASTSGGNTIMVEVTDENGCSAIASKNVVVDNSNQSIVPPLKDEEKSYLFCQNSTATVLSATASEKSTLQWYDADGNSLESAPIPNTEVSGVMYYYVSQTTEGYEESEKAQVLVYINAGPSVSLTPSKYAVYENTEVSVTAISNENGGTFVWSLNGKEEKTEIVDELENTSSLTKLLTTGGEYVFSVSTSDANGCVSNTSVSVTVKSSPSVKFPQDSYDIYVGDTVLIKPIFTSISTVENLRVSLQENGEGFAKLILNEEDGTCTVIGLIPGNTSYLALDFGYYDEETGNTVSMVETCHINVKLSAKAFSFGTDELLVEEDGTTNLTVRSSIPSHLFTIEWTSKDEEIATVGMGQNGTYPINGLKQGSTTLTAKITVGEETCEKTLSISVVESEASKIGKPVIAKTSLKYCVGDVAEQIEATPSKDGATIKWVDQYGQLLSAAPTPSTDYDHTETYMVSQVLDGIEGKPVTIQVTIYANPALSLYFPTVVYQDTEVSLTANSAAPAMFIWSVATDFPSEMSYSSTATTTFRSIGTEKVAVSTTTGFCSDNKEAEIKVKELPTVSFEKESYTVMEGKTITLEPATNFTLQNNIGWSVEEGGEEIVSVDNGVVTALKEGTATITASTYYRDDETEIGETYYGSCSIVVTPKPRIALPSVESENILYCKGAVSKQLSASLTEEASELKWYDANENGLDAAPIPSTNVTGLQTYYVSQIVDGEESDKVAVNVNVKENPSVQFAPAVTTVYKDSLTTFAVESVNETSSYLWKIDGKEAANKISFDAVGSYIVSVSEKDSDGCVSDEVSASISVKETPAISIVEKALTVYVDDKSTLSITANFTVTNDVVWSIDDQTVASVEDGAVTGLKEGTATVTASVLYYDEETQVEALYSAMCSLTVAPVPTVESPTVSKTEVNYCKGDNAKSLSAKTTVNGAKIVWYDINGTALESAPVPSTEVAGIQKYYVSQIVDNIESKKIAVTVTVNELPVVSFEPENTVVYKGVSVSLSVSSVNQGSTYLWKVGDTEISTESSASKTFNAVGTYAVSVVETDSNGCTSESKSVDFTVKNIPAVSFAKSSVVIYEADNVTLEPQFSNFASIGNISWTVRDSQIVSVENGVVSGLKAGKTTVTCSVLYKDSETNVEKTYSAVCNIEVREDVAEIICKTPYYEMFVGEYMIVDAEVHSLNSLSYHLEISDTLLADVVDKMITAVAPGELKVYAISDEKSTISDTMTVLIKEFIPAKELSMPKQIAIKVGRDTTLSATVIPFNASYKDVFFLEKNDDVIAVSTDGTVTGKSVGTSIVTASTREGVQAQTLVYVTASEEEIVKIQVPDTVYVKLGEVLTIPCKVSPTTIKSNDMTWRVADESIASVTTSGILTGKEIGGTILTVTYGTKWGYVVVYVTKSVAPTISRIPDVMMQQQGEPVVVDLEQYISCDTTLVNKSDIAVAASVDENVEVSFSGMVATFSLKNPDYVGRTQITISAADTAFCGADTVFLVTKRVVDVQVDEKPNDAPYLLTNSITVPYQKYTQIMLTDLAADDYTAASNLTFKFDGGDNLVYKIYRKTSLRVYALEDEWSGTDSIQVSITDGDGLESVRYLTVHVLSASENQAPVILPFPLLCENDTVKFPNIELSQYVTDDYTSPSSIVWTASTSENVSVKIKGSYAEIADLNEYWRGAEVITFTAMDQGGLTSSIDVTFYRETTTTEEENDFGWYGKPTVSIITSRYQGTPGETFTVIGTFYGTNCSGIWEIEGVEMDNPNDLIQNIAFDSTGSFNAKFIVQYGEEQKITDKTENLNVYGVKERTPVICYGMEKLLVATEGVDSYEWSTGETTAFITVNPLVTTDYYLTMKKGLVTMTDTVSLRVSVPVQLPKDSVMCEGTTFELIATGEELYDSYEWSTGETTPSIVIPSVKKEYMVKTSIAMSEQLVCNDSASFKVTAINALPPLNLGNDTAVCDKQVLKLDAGTGYEYAWNFIKNDQQLESSEQVIVLDSSAYVTVKITDDNRCESFDTINVTFTYPYPEEIGVVTFSESSKNIIVAWERTVDVNTSSYQVQCQLNNDVWKNVGEPVDFNEFGIVVDEASNYEKNAYNYRLETTDGCGNKAYSGKYRSSYLQQTKTNEGKLALSWWTYRSPREGNVVGSYLISQNKQGELRADDLIPGYSVVEQFPSEDDYIGWTDVDNNFVAGDVLRVAFLLDEMIYEDALKDKDGNVLEHTLKSESGPFAIAISNIAEVENDDAIRDLFPADVTVYPTIVKDVINVVIASNEFADFKVDVLNSKGQIVSQSQTGMITKTLLQIPASSFGQGVYNVRISVDGVSKTIEVVK
ncbi:MAG: Ig-like domain-containing protein [Bacteroidales bacterium]|nr:Ig-like domain-containing protein [Bacteroidales bacterium]